MSLSFQSLVRDFSEKAFVFDANSSEPKVMLLKKLSKSALHISTGFLTYHSLLLFTITHPQNKAVFDLAQKELKRLTTYLKIGTNASHALLADTGLPYTTLTTRYSPEVFNELIGNKQLEIRLDSIAKSVFDLNAFCNISLPSILKEETTAGLDNESLMELLGVPNHKKFEFLLNEINNIKASPLAKDYLWQYLEPFFCLKGKHASFSKSYNKVETKSIFFTEKLSKQFDQFELLDQKLSPEVKLSKIERNKLIAVIQHTMTLSMREIDPVSYMDKNSLRFYHLSNGLSIAICGMVPERQLTLQSYVGYTLFKNGYPISYGGAWIFGKCALFALNIFEEYRGGESKYVMTQILRLYRQLFDVCYFEVEPFQFGNEDALQSGAFWFYYKFGFRPKEKDLIKLANSEVKKIEKNKAYKSSIKILSQLANGNIALHLNKEAYVHRNEIMKPVLQLITKQYKGNHAKAIAAAKKYYINLAPEFKKLSAREEIVFEEIALWALALKITDRTKLGLMTKMIKAKSEDYILYNQLILRVT